MQQRERERVKTARGSGRWEKSFLLLDKISQDRASERAAQRDRKFRPREREEKMGLAVLLLAALALPCVSWAETAGNSTALGQDRTAQDIQVRLLRERHRVVSNPRGKRSSGLIDE